MMIWSSSRLRELRHKRDAICVCFLLIPIISPYHIISDHCTCAIYKKPSNATTTHRTISERPSDGLWRLRTDSRRARVFKHNNNTTYTNICDLPLPARYTLAPRCKYIFWMLFPFLWQTIQLVVSLAPHKRRAAHHRAKTFSHHTFIRSFLQPPHTFTYISRI